ETSRLITIATSPRSLHIRTPKETRNVTVWILENDAVFARLPAYARTCRQRPVTRTHTNTYFTAFRASHRRRSVNAVLCRLHSLSKTAAYARNRRRSGRTRATHLCRWRHCLSERGVTTRY